jgi:hypothetical protein
VQALCRSTLLDLVSAGKWKGARGAAATSSGDPGAKRHF